ncbi:MAG: nucleotidyltransferase [Polyangiaceae bacterium]|nr:nucleotidyltransferase [Polyangiaceae bacterium]
MTVDLSDPTRVALLAASSFAAAGIRHALYGGLLLAAYGRARETRDADFAVLDVAASAARDVLAVEGIDASASFADVRFGGLYISRIALVGGGALNTVALVRPRSDRFARAVLDRAVTAPLRDQSITVVTPEDFIVLKVLSTRESDLDDAASVLTECRDAVDRELVEREVALLGAELPDVAVTDRWSGVQGRTEPRLGRWRSRP